MASGQAVVQFHKVMPPGSGQATMDQFAGGSTPAESIEVHDFDDTTAEYLDFLCSLNGYAGGGLTFLIEWTSEATSGAVAWEIAIRRTADDAEAMTAAHTYDFNTVVATTASAAREPDYATRAFTDGADMDSVANGEFFILRIRRDPSNGSDNLSGDAELHGIVGSEV